MQIEVINRVKDIDKAIAVMDKWPYYSIDIETVGDKAVELYETSAKLLKDSQSTSKLEKLRSDYQTLYKGRNKEHAHLIKAEERRLNKLAMQSKAAYRTAMNHPSSLNFQDNSIGAVGLCCEDQVYIVKGEYFYEDTHSLKAFLGLWLRKPHIMHRAQFDYKHIWTHWKRELRTSRLFDTYIAAKVIDGGRDNPCDLQSVAQRYLGAQLNKDKEVRCANWCGKWTDEMVQYLADDVCYLSFLKTELSRQLNEMGLLNVYELERDLITTTINMEIAGLGFNMDLAKQLKAELVKEVSTLEKDVQKRLSISNPNSNAQVLVALNERGHDIKNTDKKTLAKISTDEDVKALLLYRQKHKLLSTYMDSIINAVREVDENGIKHFRVFTNFNQLGTDSGRYSSSEPNLQNLPADPRYRSLIIPRPGYKLLQFDTAQIELRVLAALSKDPILMNAFIRGEDPHLIAASLIYNIPKEAITKEQRYKAKTVGFGIIYGQTSYGLSNALNISEKEAQRFIDSYLNNFYGVKKFIERTKKELHEQGYVKTLAGRIRYFNQYLYGPKNLVEYAERAAVNHKVQGLAADCFKEGLLYWHKYFSYGGILEGCFHDEGLLEVPECSKLVSLDISKYEVETAIKEGFKRYIKDVPIVLEPKYVAHWGEAK